MGARREAPVGISPHQQLCRPHKTQVFQEFNLICEEFGILQRAWS